MLWITTFLDPSTLSTIFKTLIGAGWIGAVITAVINYVKWRKERGEVTELIGEVGRLNGSLGSLKQQLDNGVSDRDQLRSDLEKSRRDVETLSAQKQSLENDVTRRERIVRQQENRSKKMLGMEGEFWRAKTQTKRPNFVPINGRAERRPAIFSILSLKGGVGKTTLTANIGAVMASMGQRVLFIDVDFQGSLTSLVMPFDKISSLHADKLMLQDFLTTISKRGPLNLLPYTQPVFERCHLVPTSDHLAYADMNLMMTWMLRIARHDSRFLLRRGLHQKRIFSKFDVILIDCPPLLSTGCINALAASDFVLIPATPSEHSVDRVPQLLHTLKHSIASLNPHLSVAGIVYNHTQRSQLSAWEKATWNSILKRAEDQCGSPVRGFSTYVRRMTEIRDNESDFVPPSPGSERYEVFRALADELLEVVPSGSNQVR